MKISREQKDKILEYLCKKFGIEKFFMYNNAMVSSVLFVKMLNSSSFFPLNRCVFAKTTPIFINTTEQIIDILLQEAKENDIFIGTSLKILEKGTTIEQLAIEADLNC